MWIRNILKIDFLLLFASLALVTVGVLFIYSSGLNTDRVLVSNEYIRQIVWASAGLILALALALLNYRRMYDFSVYLYLGTILLLIVTLFFRSRWLRIGPVGLQVSEFAKITTIVLLAWFLDMTQRLRSVSVRFIAACLIVFVPMALILIQPDLGTSLVFIPILLGMTFVSGISLYYIFFLLLLIVFTSVFLLLPIWQTVIMKNAYPELMALVNVRFAVAACLFFAFIAALSWLGFRRYRKRHFFWFCYGASILSITLGASYVAQRILKEYQMMRLIIFMDPSIDPRGAGWHILQSITAIGSGGMYGRGYLHGTHSQYRFLPEQSTDFIFAILSEEWGFFGGVFVFALFLFIALRLVKIMQTTSDLFGSYIVAGLVSMYSFHFLVNVGMTMGVMPVTGIPLTFVSYGGSALVSAMAGIGLALSVHIRRFKR